LVGWNIEYSQFYADLCIALHFREAKDPSYIHLGALNLDRSPEDPSRSVALYHDPWWVIHNERTFPLGGEVQWARAIDLHRSQATSSFVWKDSHFFDQLEYIALTLNRFVSNLGSTDDIDIWNLEETESRLGELEEFLATTRDTMIDSERARSAQAVLYMLASRARAALRVGDKTQYWSKLMEEEIVRSLFYLLCQCLTMSKWDGLEVVGHFYFSGWFFDIPRFYRSVALSDDKERREMNPDVHLTDLTVDLPSYDKAWWETEGQGLAGIDEILCLDCSQVGSQFMHSLRAFLTTSQQIAIDDGHLTPITDRMIIHLRQILELLKGGCTVEDNNVMHMLGEIERTRHLYS